MTDLAAFLTATLPEIEQFRVSIKPVIDLTWKELLEKHRTFTVEELYDVFMAGKAAAK